MRLRRRLLVGLRRRNSFEIRICFFVDDLAEEARRGLGLMVLKTWMRMRVLMWLILTA